MVSYKDHAGGAMKQVIATFYGFALLMLMTSEVMAGWFGPDNYEDCILEKMKNQPKNMMSYARDACRKKFPYEKEQIPLSSSKDPLAFLYYGGPSGNYEESDLELTWCDTSPSSLSICISKNETDYRITKAIMAFSEKKCEGEKPEDFTEKVTFTFSRWIWRDKSTVEVKDAGRFKCMRQVQIYGM